MIKGALSTQQTGLSDNPNITEFIVKNTAGNILLKVDSSTGDLSIRGIKSEEQSTIVRTSAPEFLIVDAGDPPVGSPPVIPPVIRLDENGNLDLKGKVFP